MNFKLSVAILLATCGLAQAKDFKETANGITDFDTPSMNMCCSYVPTKDSGPLLACTRVQPKYWNINLEASGKLTVYKNPGEAPGCGYGQPVGNVLGYGETWKAGAFSCTSERTGLTCTANGKGFVLSRKGLKTFK